MKCNKMHVMHMVRVKQANILTKALNKFCPLKPVFTAVQYTDKLCTCDDMCPHCTINPRKVCGLGFPAVLLANQYSVPKTCRIAGIPL